MNRTVLAILFAGVLVALNTGCASTTVIRSNPSGAIVRNIRGEKVGKTPYAFSGGGMINSTEQFTLEKPGYEPSNVTIRRDQVNGWAMAGWIGAGATLTVMWWNIIPLGLAVPALWAADFAPSYEVDLDPVPQPAADPQAVTDEPGKDVKVVVVKPAPSPTPRASRR